VRLFQAVSAAAGPWHGRAMTRTAPPPPAVTEAALREAALRHLARYGTTVAGLTRVLDRRIGRWARAVEAEAEQLATAKAAVRAVVARLAQAGAVDDAAFATTRARSLVRSGRSRLAVAAHLAVRGVAGVVSRAAMPDDPDADFAAAIAATRRRRIGPFRAKPPEAGPLGAGPADAEVERRELGILARAGFPQELARRALHADRELAEAVLARLRAV